MAIDQSALRYRASRLSESELRKTAGAALGATRNKAFLCHSHLDDELAKGIISWFSELGVDLYVDWQDPEMPASPTTETAKKLQERIRSSNVFLFLATENSRRSRWCPWEIGFADASSKKIWILPTRDSTSAYGNEYLGLYPHIDQAAHVLRVIHISGVSAPLQRASDLLR